MFIQDMSCISAQSTFDDSFFTKDVRFFDSTKIIAEEPDYAGLIPRGQLRRMSKLMRMSVVTAMPLIQRHPHVNGIIIASSNGSVDRSLRFLSQIIEYDEGTLTPTDFVQSTANCIAGGLALMGRIRGYNTTHVNEGLSFESALLDALLQFEEDDKHQLLVGGGEEVSEGYYNIESKRNIYKDEDINTKDLLKSNTKGTVLGEGVGMFVMSASKTYESIAEIKDVDMISNVDHDELADKCIRFLDKNKLKPADIDAVIFGRSGDSRTDMYYDRLEQKLFPKQSQFVFKLLTGDYCTVAAFATWLAAKLLSGASPPAACVWRQGGDKPKNILLYNHCEGLQHGFILMNSIK